MIRQCLLQRGLEDPRPMFAAGIAPRDALKRIEREAAHARGVLVGHRRLPGFGDGFHAHQVRAFVKRELHASGENAE